MGFAGDDDNGDSQLNIEWNILIKNTRYIFLVVQE